MTRRSPYRRFRCGGRSLLLPKHNTVAGFITLAVIIFSALVLQRFGVPKAIGWFLGLYVFVVGGVMSLFMRLRPVEK
jgi:hypothetical protein